MYIEQEDILNHISAKPFHIISEAADELGVEAYVIGGYVRDIFLYRPSKDIDVVAVGSGIELAKAVAGKLGKKTHLSVFKNFGISVPRSSSAQRTAGTSVAYSEAQPGDVICYAGHVAIYMGNGRIVHASNPKSGITTGSATFRTILSIRRFI